MGKSLGTGYRAWLDIVANADLIDAPIRPLVESLNRATWAHTIFSCAGHPEEPDSIQTGRRQAHVDLLISDEPRWYAFIAAVKRTARGVRVTDGDLGDPPAWLPSQLPAGVWRYRRLVLEPTPYDQPAGACRRTLDAALTAAVRALEEAAC